MEAREPGQVPRGERWKVAAARVRTPLLALALLVALGPGSGAHVSA